MKSSKKILTGILTTVMSLSSLGINSFASSGIPVDVEGTRFVEPIRILQALDIMNGDGDGKFRPNDTIKRSEVAKMAVLAMGLVSCEPEFVEGTGSGNGQTEQKPDNNDNPGETPKPEVPGDAVSPDAASGITVDPSVPDADAA